MCVMPGRLAGRGVSAVPDAAGRIVSGFGISNPVLI